MSNEELVIRIQSGEMDLMGELWGQVERYVMSKASKLDFMLATMQNRSYNSKTATGVLEQGDFCNAGYEALVKAVETYNPEMELPFLPWFMLYLKTAFAEATGYRTKKDRMDPLKNALSLDKPLDDEAGGASLGDIVPDAKATATLTDIEERVWLEQLREAMKGVLAELPDEQSTVLRQRYYDQRTLAGTALQMGTTVEEVRKLENKGIKALRRYKLANRIRPFYDFDCYAGTGLNAFRHTGLSVQERYLIQKEKQGCYRQEECRVRGLEHLRNRTNQVISECLGSLSPEERASFEEELARICNEASGIN